VGRGSLTGRPPFVILGAGPCGLSAAWHLARAGHTPIVIEREPLVGGLCATHARGDFRFDLGGHRFVSSSAELSRWLEQLLGDDLLVRERRSVVLHEGRAFAYPLEARNLVENLGVRENARALAGFARARLARAALPRASRDRTFEEWVTSRFGRPLYDTFFGPYTEKLWGIPPGRISADWAAERISLLDLGDAALRLARLRRAPTRTYARRYLYPRLGMGQLYEAMAKDVVARGGTILTGVRIAGLETTWGQRSARATAVHVDGPGGPDRIPVGELLSTIPLPELARLLRPALPAPVERAAARLRFRALTFVNLMLDRESFSPNTWMYVATAALKTSRIQEPKRRSEAMAPPGRTSLMLEVPCDVGDDVWTQDPRALAQTARAELRALGFTVDDVRDSFVVRVSHGYPVYHLSYDEDRRALLGEVSRFSNVRSAGRQGLFRYIFMDAAMSMGVAAAESMLAGVRETTPLDAIGRKSRVIEVDALTA
jgi:protoporphyrinogen oxidase